MTAGAQQDGYIECSECGHPIEQHDTDACQASDACSCPTRWTPAEIRTVRKRAGLPTCWEH